MFRLSNSQFSAPYYKQFVRQRNIIGVMFCLQVYLYLNQIWYQDAPHVPSDERQI